MTEPKSQFDHIKFKIKNNPIIAFLMIFGAVIIAVSSFTDATHNLLNIMASNQRPDINGRWTAEIIYPWDDKIYKENLTFNGDGDSIYGDASFLEKSQIILEGKIQNGQLEFKTKTLEFSPDWDDNSKKMATHLYKGNISDNLITFVMDTYGGFSAYPPTQFTIKRVTPLQIPK